MATAHKLADQVQQTTWDPWADIHETHSGVVVLLGDRALKFKKPVDLGFLDFSTSDRRRDACLREVELNRRLTNDVYLGVADMVGTDGMAMDHVVLMRRMPEERRLSTLVRSGTGVEDEIRDVARHLASFHTRAERSEAIARDVSSSALRALWETSLAQMTGHAGEPVPADVVADIGRLVRRYLQGRQELFAQRATTGSVLDGHGDLMAEDIFCLSDGPRILDCLEFDDRLRHVDQVDDAAFLAMDLEHLGAPDLATRFLDWYAEFSGDNAPVSLVEHYVAYRAFVRCKVACVRHAQGDPAAAAEARRFASAALSHLQQGALKLVLVGGGPGVGKSTLAAGLADRLGMTLVASDRVRKESAHLPPTVAAVSDLDTGIYAPERTQFVYEELLRRAAMLLRVGESVVLDATWGSQDRRDLAEEVAAECAVDLVQLRCVAPAEVADTRLRARAPLSDAGTASDATPAVAARLRDAFEAWPAARCIDTTETEPRCLDRAASFVRPRDPRTVVGPRSRIEPD